jgi:hypothetical protein
LAWHRRYGYLDCVFAGVVLLVVSWKDNLCKHFVASKSCVASNFRLEFKFLRHSCCCSRCSDFKLPWGLMLSLT